MKSWAKLDKFYVVLAFILIFMSALVIVTSRSMFSAYLTAYEIDQSALEVGLKINKESLDEAYNWVFYKSATPLNN